jgi:hypothetical protein
MQVLESRLGTASTVGGHQIMHNMAVASPCSSHGAAVWALQGLLSDQLAVIRPGKHVVGKMRGVSNQCAARVTADTKNFACWPALTSRHMQLEQAFQNAACLMQSGCDCEAL